MNAIRWHSRIIINCGKYLLNTRLQVGAINSSSTTQWRLATNQAKALPQTAAKNKQIGNKSKKSKLKQPNESITKLAVQAFSTSEEYILEEIDTALQEQGAYELNDSENLPVDVLSLSIKNQTDPLQRHFFLFREGCVVFWNVDEDEKRSILKFLTPFQRKKYDEDLVLDEAEDYTYKYENTSTRIDQGNIVINHASSIALLEHYTFSNALANSVKLAMWESILEDYVEGIKYITEDMESGKMIKLSRQEVFKKTGKLLNIRHEVNLNSNFLDSPDFYWDRHNLEQLFKTTSNLLNIRSRTRVLNEKINNCVELMGLLEAHLNDKHHVRLEWMIIILIMVEVAFEFIHYAERLFGYHNDRDAYPDKPQ